MVRTPIGLAAVAAAALFSVTFIQGARAQNGMPAGYAAPRGDTGYGGGFIELLMTGREPGAPPRGSERRSLAGPAPRPVAHLSSGDPYDPMPRQPAYAQPAYGQRGYGQEGYGQVSYARPQPAYATARPDVAPEPSPYAGIARGPDPRFMKQEVAYAGSERPGTIVIDTPLKYLYLVQGNGRALRYGIGVGRPGFAWAGVKTVSRKAEWPGWTPPPEMLRRRPDLPQHMAGGPGNPLGARALYLGSSLYRIHGTNEPHTIGQSVSSGCIRMMNEDVTDLYERVPVGATVVVM